MALADVASDMTIQVQAIQAALQAGDLQWGSAGATALQTAYDAVQADVKAAQPLLAQELSGVGLNDALLALSDLSNQLTTIASVTYPVRLSSATTQSPPPAPSSSQIAAATTAAQNAFGDAVKIQNQAAIQAQDNLTSGPVATQVLSEEQRANAGAEAEAAAIAAEHATQATAGATQQADAGAAAQAAQYAADVQAGTAAPPLPAIPVGPTAPTSPATTALVVGGVGLAAGALAWWYFL